MTYNVALVHKEHVEGYAGLIQAAIFDSEIHFLGWMNDNRHDYALLEVGEELSVCLACAMKTPKSVLRRAAEHEARVMFNSSVPHRQYINKPIDHRKWIMV